MQATEWLAANLRSNLSGVLTAAVPYLHLAVTVSGGWKMAKSALAAAAYLDKGEGDLPSLPRQDRYSTVLCFSNAPAGSLIRRDCARRRYRDFGPNLC